MNGLVKTFALPLFVWLLALIGSYWYGGAELFFTTALLTILEVTLSFDNAVVNAKILARMDAKWQIRFLTWGIVIAVVGTRLILPILIVAASIPLSPLTVAALALADPASYGALLAGAHAAIASFGATFLLMVSLKYFFDTTKEVHWLKAIERHVAKWGRIESVEIGIALVFLVLIAAFSPEHAATILIAGAIGLILFIAMQGVEGAFTIESASAGALALFIYLNILDAAFSLDGVVGAFAITNEIVAIVVGLGVGAYFVRTLTLYMVRKETLHELVYLEHGAHWAILGLAASMYASLFVEVPEAVTGLVGLAFVSAAYYSSLRKRASA